MPFTKTTKSLLTIIFFFLSAILIFPTTAHADDAQDLLKIYCSRRQGNQLNLETWYGGKCEGTLEESIGFGDIILLDVMEKIGGNSPESDILEQIKNNLVPFSNLNKMNPFARSIVLSKAIADSKISNNNGLINHTGKAISYLYTNPPASSLDYLADIGSRLTNRQIIKPAYAAETGYGFQALSAILPVWRTFRNMAYLIFALGFIVYGFMIMFQIKLSAQTVASIQTALPKLIITLVLISFSYAIAGFLIDIFYLITGLIFSVFMAEDVLENSGWGVISGQTLGIFGSGIIYALNVVTNMDKVMAGIMSIPESVSTLITFIMTPLTLLVALVLLIAIAITFGKIFWMLLKAYVNILISVIFSPLMLLGNIMPGSTAFSNWAKGIFAELSVFATTMIFLVLSFYFFGIDAPLWSPETGAESRVFGLGTRPDHGSFWQPYPLYGNILEDLPIDTADGRFALLGLGILFILPKTADMIRQALKVQNLGFESAIGEALKGGWSPIGRPINTAINTAWSSFKKPYQAAFDTEMASRAPKWVRDKSNNGNSETQAEPLPH
jgi:hypothetical protein